MPAITPDAAAPGGPETPRAGFAAGPPPPWAVVCAYPEDFKGKAGLAVTHLLLSQQIHAEQRQTCIQSALRLETMEAVQHESQWRLQFDPNTQTVSLHWIRIRRGAMVFDHTRPERFRVLQREEALEGFILDGCCTLLMLLEDVRSGDILEAAYTVTTKPRLLPDHCWSFFAIPPHISVGSYYYAIRFATTRNLQWKISSPEVTVETTKDGAETLLVWAGKEHTGLPSEVNIPDWHIDHPWVQVSDCSDWRTVAAGFAAVWQARPEAPELVEITERIQSEEPELLTRVDRAIRLIQDEFRYLSVDFETGGHVPAEPAAVARRRYGDCKDLSFLLVHLLRGLGVAARPVLVNSRLRGVIADKLPTPGLFDHVVVEIQLPEGTRWVDPTLRNQGGSAVDRVIPDYGVGLPVDAAATALVAAPPGTSKDAFEHRESLLLDTAGGSSLLAVTVRATGSYAESLRRQFECRSLEDITRERLDTCKQRFGLVERQGALTFRDDRPQNEFWLVEVFEISSSLLPAGEVPERIQFPLPSNMVLSALAMPESTPRRTPYALPFPCDLTHTIELHSPGLQSLETGRHQVGNAYVRFSRSHKTMAGFWSVSSHLTTLADAVPAEKIAEHRKLLHEINRETAEEVTLATQFRRVRQRGDFGTLPPPPEAAMEKLVPRAPSIPYKPRHPTDPQPYSQVARSPAAYRKEVRKFRQRQKRAKWVWTAIILLLLTGLIALFVFVSKH